MNQTAIPVPGNDRAVEEAVSEMIDALTCYHIDDNPLHLWSIYRVFRVRGLEVPVPVLEYLDEVAGRLDLATQGYDATEGVEHFVYRAVVPKSTPGKGKNPLVTRQHLPVIQEAKAIDKNLSLSDGQKDSLASKHGMSRRNVERWIAAWRKATNFNNNR